MGRRRTVLHLIDTGGPGGAETIFRNLVTGLGAGWRSVPVVPVRDWLHESLREHGIEPVLMQEHDLAGLAHLRAIIRLIRRHQADLVQTHLLGSAVYASLAAVPFRIPVVSTFHGLPDIPPRGLRTDAKVRILSRRGNRVVFVSSGLRERMLASHRFPVGRTRVVLNGVALPPADVAPVARAELGASAGDYLVGAVGNLRPAKDYATLLRAAAVLVERGVPLRMVIAGEGSGPLLEELLLLRSQLGLVGRVEFLGFRPDVHRLLATFDAFASSSSSEGFSLASVEALALGKPVVATRSGGPEEILLDGRTGLLVPTADPAALADALERLHREPELGRRLGAAGNEDVRRRFPVERMVTDYERIYREALGDASAPA